MASRVLRIRKHLCRDLPKIKRRAVQYVRRARLGSDAPVPGELLYVPTQQITSFIIGSKGRRSETGHVSSTSWNPPTAPLVEFPKISACIDHWQYGVPWEHTNAFDRMMEKIQLKGEHDGCRTLSDVRERYHRLDAIFAEVATEGALRPAGAPFSEQHCQNGIIVHFDREGTPLFGLGGCHRLAMAVVLGLPKVPVLIGRVHPQGAKWINRYRNEVHNDY